LSFQLSKDWHFSATAFGGGRASSAWSVGMWVLAACLMGGLKRGVTRQRNGLQNKKAPREALFACLLAERATANIVSNIVQSNLIMNLKSLIYKHL